MRLATHEIRYLYTKDRGLPAMGQKSLDYQCMQRKGLNNVVMELISISLKGIQNYTSKLRV